MKSLAMLLVLLAFATSGCGKTAFDTQSPAELENNLTPVTVELNDRQTVECVVYDQYREGGISCVPSKSRRR